jgi:hypothetical protein
LPRESRISRALILAMLVGAIDFDALHQLPLGTQCCFRCGRRP